MDAHFDEALTLHRTRGLIELASLLARDANLLPAVMNHLPYALFVADVEGRLVLANDRFARAVGRPVDAVVGSRAVDLPWVGEVARVALAEDLAVIESGEACAKTLELTRADGVRELALVVKRPILIGPRAERCLLGVVAELGELGDRPGAGEASQPTAADLRAFLESTRDLVLTVALDGKIVRANRAFREAVGYGPDEVSGLSIDALLDPAGAVEWHEAVARLGRDDRPTHRPITLRTRWGDRLDLDAYLTPDAHDGRPTATHAVLHDVSAIRRAELAERRYHEELSKADPEHRRLVAVKAELLAAVSHELRTPLDTVLGISTAFTARVLGERDVLQADGVDRIHESGEHLLALVDDLIDLSSVSVGAVALAIGPVDVDALCASALRAFREPALLRGLRVQLRCDEMGVSIFSDARRLERVLYYLLGNALRLTPSGGCVGVDVKAPADGGALILEVWDTGVGIAEAERVRAFEPFSELDGAEARRYGGGGLGLALVKRLAALLGGDLTLQSRPGQGTRYALRLPVDGPPEAPTTAGARTSARPSSPSGAHRSALLGPISVLAVDDHEPNLETLEVFLRSRGFEFVAARNGAEAVAAATARSFDVILMDIQMPEMDGMEAIRRIRALPTPITARVVALTALAMAGDRERCLAAGADLYVPKPVSLRELASLVERLARR